MNAEYLDRSLSHRVGAVRTDCANALDRVMRQNAAAGRLASGASLKMFKDETLSAFQRAYIDAQQFTFSLTESHEEGLVTKLSGCASEMIDALMSEVTERSGRLGIQGEVVPNQLEAIRHGLEDIRARLTDDFRFGMKGSERLKKDPVVSIVSNQTNSPGAVQQIGVGDFSQKAFVQNHQPLIDAINKALASPEYQSLRPDQKDALKDVADTLLEEAKKEKPDPGKLKRWGHRLADLGKDLGLHVLATEIVHIMGGMFSG
ncbi:hypothetical protein [Bradyrhizobium ottawaense]|uniref:Uncharacterized protein n=1 Tax=Bradyrhizobium ottawaense TaxID=931866 RepID=A0ABV4FQE3_9BRAD|nr:hypothetical protein [Bradyrhizobium ottawaense]MBR1288663.1 hypothetical protein [Bradyrhizobium ottawaense]